MEEHIDGVELGFKKLISEINFISHYIQNNCKSNEGLHRVVQIIKRIQALESKFPDIKSKAESLLALRESVIMEASTLLLKNQEKLDRIAKIAPDIEDSDRNVIAGELIGVLNTCSYTSHNSETFSVFEAAHESSRDTSNIVNGSRKDNDSRTAAAANSQEQKRFLFNDHYLTEERFGKLTSTVRGTTKFSNTVKFYDKLKEYSLKQLTLDPSSPNTMPILAINDFLAVEGLKCSPKMLESITTCLKLLGVVSIPSKDKIQVNATEIREQQPSRIVKRTEPATESQPAAVKKGPPKAIGLSGAVRRVTSTR